MAKQIFKWDDPLLFNDQLDNEERMIRDTARKFCQNKLMPGITEANRTEQGAKAVQQGQADDASRDTERYAAEDVIDGKAVERDAGVGKCEEGHHAKGDPRRETMLDLL